MKINHWQFWILFFWLGGQAFAQAYIPMTYGSGPFATAINPETNVGVVVNRYLNYLVTIDLTTNSTLSEPLRLDTNADTTKRGLGPISVAINPATNQAVVANFDSNNITVISLADPKVPTIVGTVAVGKNPRAVAIDTKQNIAIVANLTANNVSLVDLSKLENLLPTPIVVGQGPIDVVYVPEFEGAIVVNYQGDGSLENISLLDMKLKIKIRDYTDLGFFRPAAIALDQEKKLAVIANSQLNSSTISVVDYSKWPAVESLPSVPVGIRPISVDVNQKTHIATVLSSDTRTMVMVNLSDTANLIKMNTGLTVENGATDVTVDSARNTALVSNPLKDTVYVYSMTRQQYLPLAVDTEAFRSNLGINNLSAVEANVSIELRNEKGELIGSGTKKVPAGGLLQINQVVRFLLARDDLTNAQGTLRMVADQSISCFISVIDNISNDPSIQVGRDYGGSNLLINSVTNVGAYRSQVVIQNIGGNPALLSLAVRNNDKGEIIGSATGISVPVGGYFSVADIMEYLKVPAGNYGPLEISDSNLSTLLAVSRVYSQSNTSGFLEAIPLP